MCGTIHHCDFIILDEPTQNMDEIRRENLAEQLQNVRGFKQMFVISHDDTFTEPCECDKGGEGGGRECGGGVMDGDLIVRDMHYNLVF